MIYDLNYDRNKVLLNELSDLSKIFKKEKISYCLIKGSALLVSDYYENIGNRISPKLKTNTFIKNVKCSRPISNRAFRFEFLIRVDVNGNVVSIDYADKRKYDNLRRTHKQAAQVIKNALERASYSPGTISNLVAEMEYIQTISISENLC